MRRSILYLGVLSLLALFIFQPAAAQDGGYIDSLATQAALDTQATQGAGSSIGGVSSALAALAYAQQQAAAASYRATADAGVRQQQIVAQQATSSAFAQRETAVAQQTQSAIAASVTAQAVSVEQTRVSSQATLEVRATSAVIEATRTASAIEASGRQNAQRATATADALAGNLRATATTAAINAYGREVDTALTNQANREQLVTLGLGAVVFIIALLAISVAVIVFRRWLARHRTPAAPEGDTYVFHVPAETADVYDPATGETSRLPVIRHTDAPPSVISELLNVIHGQQQSNA